MENRCHHGPSLFFPDFKAGGHLCGCSMSRDGTGCNQFIEHHIDQEKWNEVCSKRFLNIDVPEIKSSSIWERLSHIRPPWIYGIDPENPDLPSHEMMAPINGTTFESVTEGNFPRYFITENSIKDLLHWIQTLKFKKILLINMPGLHEALQLLKWTGSYCGMKIEDRTSVPVSILLDADDRLNAYFDDDGYSQGREVGSLPDPSKSKKARADRSKAAQRLELSSPAYHSSYLRANIGNLTCLPCRHQKEIYDGPDDVSLGAAELANITAKAHEEKWPYLAEILGGADCIILENFPGLRFEFLVNSFYKIAYVRSRLSNLSGSSERSLPPTFFFANPLLRPRIQAETAVLQSSTSVQNFSFDFADFPVHYVGNPFKTQRRRAKGGNENSPMRMFTNVPLMNLTAPPGQEDKFSLCKPCLRYSRVWNQHCEKCNLCVSTDCMKRNHCDKCASCVPSSFQHCDICTRCVPKDKHQCKGDVQNIISGSDDSDDSESDSENGVKEAKSSNGAIKRQKQLTKNSSQVQPAIPKMSRRFKKSLSKKRKQDNSSAAN